MESDGMEDLKVETQKRPAHELAYRQLREMILFGELTPGQAVTIQGLVAELDTGITPVREAIRRLTAEGALEFKDNRRIAVPKLTLPQLEELSFARLEIEPHLASLATRKMDSADITRLNIIDKTLNLAIARGDIRGYLEQNYYFHRELYALSQASILISISNAMWLRVGPSLRVGCGRHGTLNLPDKHEEALAAMRAGDATAVADAIKEDIQQGHQHIKSTLLGE